jgi:hypothetical protein
MSSVGRFRFNFILKKSDVCPTSFFIFIFSFYFFTFFTFLFYFLRSKGKQVRKHGRVSLRRVRLRWVSVRRVSVRHRVRHWRVARVRHRVARVRHRVRHRHGPMAVVRVVVVRVAGGRAGQGRTRGPCVSTPRGRTRPPASRRRFTSMASTTS